MRDYAKVGPKFWIGKTGKRLRAAGIEAQLVGMYLMTSPHANMLGLYFVSRASIAGETGLDQEGASKGLAGCIEAGFCSYDDESEMVWVHEMALYQIAESLVATDKRAAGVQNEYDALLDNPFLGDFFEKYAAPFKMKRNRGAVASPIEAPCKPLGSQEQEQEQAQEQEQEQEQAQADPAARPTGAVALSIAFRTAGIATQPADPRLIALAEQGVDAETIAAAVAAARQTKPDENIGLGYVVKILERWAAEAAKLRVSGAAQPRAGPPGYQTANEKAKDFADRLTGKKKNEPAHEIIDINPAPA